MYENAKNFKGGKGERKFWGFQEDEYWKIYMGYAKIEKKIVYRTSNIAWITTIMEGKIEGKSGRGSEWWKVPEFEHTAS